LNFLDADYYAKINPVSVRWVKFYLVVIDDYSRCAWVVGPTRKSEAVNGLRILSQRIRAECGRTISDRVGWYLRTDNEIVLRSENFSAILREQAVIPIRSVPYCPQQNGTIKRMMRELSEDLRFMFLGVDSRLQCYGAEYFCHVWNRVAEVYARYPGNSGERPF